MTISALLGGFFIGAIIGALAFRRPIIVKGNSFEVQANSVNELKQVIAAMHVPTREIFKETVQ